MPRSLDAVVAKDKPSVLELTLSRRGSISGCVVDTTRDALLAGVHVEVKGADGAVLGATRTGATGSYRFDNLRAGRYTVCVRTPHGFVAEVGEVVAELAASSDVEADLFVRLAGVVRGTVRDEDTGEALSKVPIEVWDSRGRLVVEGATDENGAYEFSGLAEDRYEVSVADASHDATEER